MSDLTDKQRAFFRRLRYLLQDFNATITPGGPDDSESFYVKVAGLDLPCDEFSSETKKLFVGGEWRIICDD